MNEIQWFCQHCGTEIGLVSGDGWIQNEWREWRPKFTDEWEVTCKQCDTDPDAEYAIDAVRVTTYHGFDGIYDWTEHLDRKRWANRSSWRHIIRYYSTAKL